ncbi:hypothetical protein IW140_000343 [Coemansia sp. RSA 1813]|nr:hypothetical protein EV178_000699 [Coemansia sp. RSA 1646]KAJ1773215.1 hypothetical protein LPJ74_000725 [Coemansia sp. RSA 1843]KAJ2092683.1 hypothetical protein IW138_000777 [Coemansia sp. RSA 986]KAJ2572945.1 hypothetical protein IW140_000343 [Coemansia sp. RSA 1813]
MANQTAMASTKRVAALVLCAMLAVSMLCGLVPKAAAAAAAAAAAPPTLASTLFNRCPLFDHVVGEQLLSGEIDAEEAFAKLDAQHCPIIRGARITNPQQLQDLADKIVAQNSNDHQAHPNSSNDCQRLDELTKLIWSGSTSESPKAVMDELVANNCPLLTSCAQFSAVKEKYTSGQLQPSKALEQLMQECPLFSPTVPKPVQRDSVQSNAQPPGKSMTDECIRLSDMLYNVDETQQDTASTREAAEKAMDQLCDTKVPLINNCPLFQGVKARYKSGAITAQMAIGEMKANCPILSKELNPAMIFNFEEYGMHRDPHYDMGHASHSHSDPTLRRNSQSGGGCSCCANRGKDADTCAGQGRPSAKQLYKRHEEAEDPGMCLPGGKSTCDYDRHFAKRAEPKISGLERLLGGMFPRGNPALSSLLGTFYISLFPNLILFATPSSIPNKVLRIMVAFAVGGLLGDVFLHLMPHMFADHDHSGHHDHNEAADTHIRNTVYGCTVFLGLMVFFMVDKFMRLLGGDEHSHGHSHSHGSHTRKPSKSSGSSGDNSDLESKQRLRKRHNNKKPRHMASDANEADDEKEAIDSAIASKGDKKQIKMSAYLNLVADAAHNFTDGLAMSASFYLSHAAGLSTFVAVFFHEIPHELGDFAILVQSGFSRTSALASQFFTALGAIAGTLAGILIEEAGKGNSLNLKGIYTAGVPVFVPATAAQPGSSSIISAVFGGILGLLPSTVAGVPWGKLVIPFTAGGFIYVGTVSVLPDLLQPDDEDLSDVPSVKGRAAAKMAEKQKAKRGVYMALVELGAMLIGLAIMAVIALGEE